jgi:nucleoside 2-deoxyribosyltransferase
MKIYLASRYERREELCIYKTILESFGYISTSRWLLGNHGMLKGVDPESSAKKNAQFAKEDLEDINKADFVLLFTDPPKTILKGGGMFVELGYAVARYIPVIIVGPRENVFCYLPEITVFNSWDEFLTEMV